MRERKGSALDPPRTLFEKRVLGTPKNFGKEYIMKLFHRYVPSVEEEKREKEGMVIAE